MNTVWTVFWGSDYEGGFTEAIYASYKTAVCVARWYGKKRGFIRSRENSSFWRSFYKRNGKIIEGSDYISITERRVY